MAWCTFLFIFEARVQVVTSIWVRLGIFASFIILLFVVFKLHNVILSDTKLMHRLLIEYVIGLYIYMYIRGHNKSKL